MTFPCVIFLFLKTYEYYKNNNLKYSIIYQLNKSHTLCKHKCYIIINSYVVYTTLITNAIKKKLIVIHTY